MYVGIIVEAWKASTDGTKEGRLPEYGFEVTVTSKKYTGNPAPHIRGLIF